MGLTRSGKHKRTKTGAKRTAQRIKRLHRMARQPSNTRIGETRVRRLRVRGGNTKLRALRLSHGNFSIKTHNIIKKTEILQVVYHGTSHELVRTNTITKGSVLKIDPTPFKKEIEEVLQVDPSLREVDNAFFSLIEQGDMYAVVTSRPGQTGTADGHVLQMHELEFYLNKFTKRNK